MTTKLGSYLSELFQLHPKIKRQQALAKKIGSPPSTVSAWITHNRMNAENLQLIATAFGVDQSWFKLNIDDFRNQLNIHFGNVTPLASLAKDSDIIQLRIWERDGSNHLVDGRHGNLSHTFGVRPKSQLKHVLIPQRTKIQIEIDLNSIRKSFGVAASDILLFSEEKGETLCLRPSPLSSVGASDQGVIIIPDGARSKLAHPLSQEHLETDTLGLTHLIVGVLTRESTNEPDMQLLLENLMQYECRPISESWLAKIINLKLKLVWIKRSFEVIT